MKYKILIIGLGSMGKRRIRNILHIDSNCNIAGFDIREDRAIEAKEKYHIKVFTNFEEAVNSFNPDVFIISTPPDKHMYYAEFAGDNNIHCFIEASVVEKERILKLSRRKNLNTLIIPSATMLFSPLAKQLEYLLQTSMFGKIISINYHTGQFLEDWHPWEKISDFYVSKREMGGCREIVPFELTWICSIFGYDIDVIGGFFGKKTTMQADIDDIYHSILRFNQSDIILNITIDVISRPFATRRLYILAENGIIAYDANNHDIEYTTTSSSHMWYKISLDKGKCENGYINPEEPYIEEIKCFLDAISQNDASIFPNTLQKDYEILSILEEIEKKSFHQKNGDKS